MPQNGLPLPTRYAKCSHGRRPAATFCGHLSPLVLPLRYSTLYGPFNLCLPPALASPFHYLSQPLSLNSHLPFPAPLTSCLPPASETSLSLPRFFNPAVLLLLPSEAHTVNVRRSRPGEIFTQRSFKNYQHTSPACSPNFVVKQMDGATG